MKAFIQLLKASFKQFFRDKSALFFTFAFPIIFMVIFGLVFSGDPELNYKIGLVNNDDSQYGTAFSQAISKIPIFTVSEGTLEEKKAELAKGDIEAVIVIPSNLSSTITSGKPADIQVYYDPAEQTASQVILQSLNSVINQFNLQASGKPAVFVLEEKSIQSHNLSSIDYLVPGILAMSILFLGLFGALPMVEWRQKQVLKRFGATPLKRSTLVLSQVIYRLILAVIQAAIIISVGYFAFHVQMVGNWGILLGLILLGTLVMVSIGYLLVSRVKTTEGALPLIQLVQFPMLFLSGIFFPIEIMPSFMRPIISAMPLTYLGDAFRQVMVDATPAYSMLLNVAVLSAWFIACMILAIRFFRWE
ncbi:MAG: ABC transporter permease [Chloroflexi bacterium]|nr:ABC transporter permease [Chloroflexota bacterium]